jgi:hypothetical protein
LRQGQEEGIKLLKQLRQCEIDLRNLGSPCLRCANLGLWCGTRFFPGAERVLRRLVHSAKGKIHRSLVLEGPHDLDILPEYPADRMLIQSEWLNSPATILRFDTQPIGRVCLELERFLRHLVFETSLWGPATNTSAMVTLLPINGYRHRFWINGTLIGLKGDHPVQDDTVQEACVLVEHYPRFPTLRSVEEYVQSRLPYDTMSRQEIRSIAEQINKRFFVIGRKLVREFSLKRKVKTIRRSKKKLIVICLRWELPVQSWGHTTWKAYFEEDLHQEVTFTSSRVSCHVDLRQWVYHITMRFPWSYSILGKGSMPPVDHRNVSTRALTWLRICSDQTLKKPAVILSLEDDPVSGMPEDNPDGVSMDALKVEFKLLSPEPLAGS